MKEKEVIMLPGEAAIVAVSNLIGKLIDGQTPEQKNAIWGQLISFWGPILNALTVKPEVKP